MRRVGPQPHSGFRIFGEVFLDAIRRGHDGHADGAEAVKVVRTLEAVERNGDCCLTWRGARTAS